MADLWTSRRQAEAALQGTLHAEAEFLDVGFDLLDMCIRELSRVDTAFGRVCAGVAIKGRNLALGSYSLALDALAQEGGALARPLIEAAQLLTYFSLDPSRVTTMLDKQRLPKAGKIAHDIGEPSLKPLRDYLSEHASHFGFTFESVQHFFSPSNGGWSLTQAHRDAVLRQNLGTLYACLYLLLLGCAQCLSTSKVLQDALADTLDRWRGTGIRLFFPALGSNGDADRSSP